MEEEKLRGVGEGWVCDIIGLLVVMSRGVRVGR